MELTESETLLSDKIVRDRRKKNLPVYNAGLGANPFPAHPKMLELFKTSIENNKGYTSPSGIEELKDTLIATYSNSNYLVDNVIIGNGLKELLFILMTALRDTHKLYLITPCWVSYIEQAKLIKIEYSLIKTHKSTNYKITPQTLDMALCDTDKQKVVILNNPTNPTGAIYYKEELKNLAKILKRHSALVISDEIYKGLVYPLNKFMTCSISHYYAKTIIGSSLSKDFNVGGWRLGWLTFTEDLITLYRRVYILSSSMYSCATTPLQRVASECLLLPTELLDYQNYMSEFFYKVGQYCYARFQDMDLITSKPHACWYIFLDFTNYKGKFTKLGVSTSTELVEFLINKLGLVTVSGKSFGYRYLTLRYSFVDIIDPEKNIPFTDKIANITRGLDKLATFLHL